MRAFGQPPAPLQEQKRSPVHYLDDQDVMQMLHICVRTLRKLRNSGELPCSTLGRKHYYLPDDVDDMIRRHRKG